MHRPLAQYCNAVVDLGTEWRCAALTLAEDPFADKLSARRAEAIGFALGAGETAAAVIVPRYGRDPEAIAQALQVPVCRSDEAAMTGRAVRFSEYGNRPPSITLYTESLGATNRLIREHGLAARLGLEDVAPVYLAHELYHHLEITRLTPGTAAFRLTTHRLGPLTFRTGLPSLCEIGADRFATTVLGLRVPPKILHFIITYNRNPDYAERLLARMEALPAS